MFGGCINDADYKVSTTKNGVKIWVCPFYTRWQSMRNRCFGASHQRNFPTYQGVILCDEWKSFMNFKVWMEQQDWEGKHLDKDLLIKGNKIYSPDTCVFVSSRINYFLEDSGASRGKYMLGVSWCKLNERFKAQGSNPFTSKTEYIGLFDTELEAHLAWKAQKHEYACRIAELETDYRIIEALTTRYL